MSESRGIEHGLESPAYASEPGSRPTVIFGAASNRPLRYSSIDFGDDSAASFS